MILEGIVSTTNDDGSPNISPMGPSIETELFDAFLLRPFQTSTTYRNLKRSGGGVLHVTDDVELFARGAIRQFTKTPAVQPAQRIEGYVLIDCCRYFEFQVRSIDDTDDRTEIVCEVLHTQELRSFFGFNRAKHAVLEAAILATRIHILDPVEILREMDRLQIIVNKTAGKSEQQAFALIVGYLQENGVGLS